MSASKTTLAAAILALWAAAARAQSGGGMVAVDPNFIGPLLPNQCRAGSPGCAPTAGGTTGAADPATEQALGDIGRQQMMESVKKEEDAMLKSGAYKSVDRTRDGKGALITMPDGSVSYSDYVNGVCLVPQKTPQDLLAVLQRDRIADPATLQQLRDIVAKADAKKNDPDQKQLAASEKKMFGGADGSKPGSDAAPGARPGSDEEAAPGAAGDGSGSTSGSSGSAFGLGVSLGQTGLLGGTGGQGAGGSGSAARGYGATAAPTAPAAINPGQYTSLKVRRAAAAPALEQLQNMAGSQTSPSDADLQPSGERRGFGATVNGR